MTTPAPETTSGIGLHTKAMIGAVLGALTVLANAQLDGDVSAGEWVAVIAALVVNLAGIPFVKNALSGPWYYAKALFAGLIAGLSNVAAAIVDHGWPLTGPEWVATVIALILGAGVTGGMVAIAPNAVVSDELRTVNGVRRTVGSPPNG